jgi:hypothetical protein
MCRETGKLGNDDEISRRQISFHEAGHAVVGEALGLKVGTLRILTEGDGTATISSATHLPVPDQIAICVAGWVGAELGRYPYQSLDSPELITDRVRAECLAASVLGGEHTDADELAVRTMLHEGAHKARELISKHRSRFDEIAEALFRDGNLSLDGTNS